MNDPEYGCGFLMRLQGELDEALPAWTSSLLLLSSPEAAQPAGRCIGAVTIDAASLGADSTKRRPCAT
jgi:hypothetical protein